jgi:ABC-type sugar transport system ATPase subunit
VARIELDGISKQFPDGTMAVRSLALDVADGELLVLAGPSSASRARS